jgi:hypothetical protein
MTAVVLQERFEHLIIPHYPVVGRELSCRLLQSAFAVKRLRYNRRLEAAENLNFLWDANA